MDITVRTVPHKNQRYSCAGDWFGTKTDMHIRVSSLGDWRYELLIAVHEIIEAAICSYKDIPEEKVTLFDLKFEKERKKGKHKDSDEPGDDKRAPYFDAHQFATHVEFALAKQLGVDFKSYSKAVEFL